MGGLLYDLADRLSEQIQQCLDLAGPDSKENGQERSLFQREYHKVIFSDYFRAMANKTQVSPIPDNDHTHTRLTHSLEVACLGHHFGYKLSRHSYFKGSKNTDPLKYLPMIVATACLLHDIGNPPFGHSGEAAIQDFFRIHFEENKTFPELTLSSEELKDFTMFDGNANGFRIITRLAGKYPEYGEGKTGFALSAITLASLLKYPFCAGGYPENKDKAKFGYFQSEKDIFKHQVQFSLKDQALLANRRHPLVYLVEAADDICYTVMDLEDAIKNGNVRFDVLIEQFKLDDKVKKTLEKVRKSKDTKREKELEKLISAYKIIREYDPNKPIHREELKALEVIRSEIIHFLVEKCFENFVNSGGSAISEGYVSHSLLDETIKFYSKQEEIIEALQRDTNPKKTLFEIFKDVKKEYLTNSLYCHDRKMKLEISGRQTINDLLTLFLEALSHYKRKNFVFEDCPTHSQYLLRYLNISSNQKLIKKSGYELCLLATDFISQCSDKHLIHLYRKFSAAE